jgi:hypothetical protein
MLHGEDTRPMRRRGTRLGLVSSILDLTMAHPSTGGARSARRA